MYSFGRVIPTYVSVTTLNALYDPMCVNGAVKL